MQDWLTLIIVLLILGILLDGIRRMRANRRNALRMSRNVSIQDAQDDPVEEERVNRSEFPSGGARVVQRNPDEVPNIRQNLREGYVASRKTRGVRPPAAEPGEVDPQTEAAGDEADIEQRVADDLPVEPREPSLGDLDNLDVDTRPRRKVTFRPESDDLQPQMSEMPVNPDEAIEEAGVTVPDAGEPMSAVDEPAAINTADDLPHHTEMSDQRVDDVPRPPPDEVMIINVMARGEHRFSGAELLQAMLDQGLRFGDMDIFHRYEGLDGDGPILYSVANMVVPGTFDLATMEEFDTPGISMFLTLPIKTDSLEAYNLMVDAAQAIAGRLDGELKDENRSVMTRQTLEHERQRVIEYDRKRRLQRLK